MKDVLEIASKFGVGGGIGFLFGWLVVWWVEPTTSGGTGLLVVISVIFWTTAVSIASKVFASKDRKAANDENAERPEQKTTSRQDRPSKLSDQWQC